MCNYCKGKDGLGRGEAAGGGSLTIESESFQFSVANWDWRCGWCLIREKALEMSRKFQNLLRLIAGFGYFQRIGGWDWRQDAAITVMQDA